ncbi:MAG: DNA mismatch repair endonuclease MutL [Oscillospiraceae bacterium]|nr:DNA mismatch repair endonuclease MutL [Oscillospiraceae bacterium]
MAKIYKMSPHLADLIAAGEVVERPASVVKELVENSIDAGAQSVTVEIRRGGMSFIRVTDDGCGMSPEDAELAFLRHASSKLTDERGLEAIRTLGFRGEALAAIAAVSNVTLVTRERGAESGVAVVLEGGEPHPAEPVGCSEGTVITVQDLFFNTPARQKFMKKDSSEGAAVTAAVVKAALSHPEVSVRYIKDDKEELHTPGDGVVSSAIYSIFGAQFFKSLLPAGCEGEGVSVSGFVSAPAAAKGNRSSQYFFVNGRCIKSQMLTTAVEQAFKSSLFTGRFPACFIYITLKPSDLDVNVHPAKTEIKFLSESQVFSAVKNAAAAALASEGPGSAELSPDGALKAAPKSDFWKKQDAESFRNSSPAPVPRMRVREDGLKYNAAPAPKPYAPSPAPREPSPAPTYDEQKPSLFNAPETPPLPERRAEAPKPAPSEEKAPELFEDKPSADYRIIGEAFGCYIICQKGDELVFIDKHAAHERMLFDALKAKESTVMPQALLDPPAVELGAQDTALLLEHLPELAASCVEVEDFGGGALIIRTLPSGVSAGDAEAFLGELAEAIRQGRRPGSLGAADEVLATVACKAAIKAGKPSDPRELVPVAKAVMAGEVRYCPHGRPISVVLPKSRLDKGIKRT